MSNQNQSLSLGHTSESQIADQSRNKTLQALTPVLLQRPHSAEPVFPQRPMLQIRFYDNGHRDQGETRLVWRLG
ncbi:hypothetical protein DPMN_186141 [Dreissena polymorpha]|uniref:Uncharacterized protein n=1 Tax=Dreissena polymorpha TaxID=45954 RepID=A0A9D4DLR7_DREPO|nr:hypothetical protein DPMN_186141 [Dreissena polymorpha]